CRSARASPAPTSRTAASGARPFGTWVRVTHARTGRSVDVLINDRGPFGVASRVIDVSREAAAALGILSEGVAPVTLSVLSRP
ncbi:septal ring lytic transglycosylase RlpA family protein, partial [Deinococcus sp. 23YEL01]|uniref:septal ring lytic transglycosylase RlpA family protein n=1 Tax=Deinococcus sp. 23YEL01 TaxID=2745871 RepID=UPI001E44608F